MTAIKDFPGWEKTGPAAINADIKLYQATQLRRQVVQAKDDRIDQITERINIIDNEFNDVKTSLNLIIKMLQEK